ncbi:MAG: cyclic nucleotide-binding domain-containing protein [Deltaproteobacteria bacterium]|nr:cyclic nucleotide-binding domain-containing protein [Deltaproteobacteria bacterium]
MVKLIGKWLKVYEDEIGLFLWCAFLFFLIRSSNILFNNFAETAFLKRFGVEYLPVVYVVNSISTFFIMGVLTGIMGRLPGSRLLTYMLFFCGGTAAGLRFVVPLGIDLLYPVLFVLKSQYELLLGLMFWNLANDLFNTRQSKRLFPLITAGGVLGGIAGSFGTPFLAKTISLDNLMLAYAVTTAVGAVTVNRMGARFPTLLLSDKKGKKTKSRSSITDEFKKVIPMIRESMLVKILIMLTLLPNVVVPILNYQFSFAIDQTFASETGMIQFFGYFRGMLNVISLIILLFVGRIYSRWGLPVALMFHPFNYVLAFLALLLRFDLFSAIYARISVNVLKITINNPARAILIGLVPPSYRSVVRPFLRGTVVRIGILLGSGIIMVSEQLVHPRYLSTIAFLFVSAWIVSTFFLKRGYSRILLDLISRDMLDIKSMEGEDMGQLFADKGIRTQLVQTFLSARGDNAIWHARLLKSLGVKDLDAHILSALKEQDDKTRIGLLEMLSPNAGEEAFQVFRTLADPGKPALMAAIAEAAARFPAELSSDFSRELFETSQAPGVKAYAVAGLYRQAPQEYRNAIDSWLTSADEAEKRAGVIAAGMSQDRSYIPRLKEMLAPDENVWIVPFVLRALKGLGAPEINPLALSYLSYPVGKIQEAALETLEIEEDSDLARVIALMGDPSEGIHDLAKRKVQDASYQNGRLLIESLTIPRRKVREGLFELLESLDIKDVDVFRFASSEIEKGYACLSEAEALRLLPESRERDLLIDHLEEQKSVQVENVLRVLAAQDRSGRMRTIWRGVSSSDPRQRANSLEALEDSMAPSLSRILVPLLEDLPISQRLAVGGKYFRLPDLDAGRAALYAHLLDKENWVTAMLTMHLAVDKGLDGLDKGVMQRLEESENPHIREMAKHYSDAALRENAMETKISITDKILHLRNINIFEGLSVGELAAVASVTEEVVFPTGDVVIKEGEHGETMYLIIEGEVSVIKAQGTDKEIELDRIGAGDYFGEMALFEGQVRSATVRTLEESRLLVLHKQEFTEIVREYPQIALHICKVLSQRMRELHQKIQSR